MGVVDYEQWERQLPALAKRYAGAEPFPHIVLENFLLPETAELLEKEFPSLTTKGWIHYKHINEQKLGKNKRELLPAAFLDVIDELNSKRFVQFVSKLSGIPGLIADNQLEGGGLHKSTNGGYLNVHADFTGHPHHKTWRRRINVLIYLNRDWKGEYGGFLELWDKQMQKCVVETSPVLNKCVIFTTDPTSYHGHPKPLNVPEGTARKSIALYYFTEENSGFAPRSTNYKPRPQDGRFKRLAILLDKTLVKGYFFLKRQFRIGDQFASSILRFVGKK